MVVRFFRLEIKGTNEESLQTIKDWFDSKIEQNDLDDNLGWKTKLEENEFHPGNFTFTCDMFIKLSVTMNKYRDILVNKFQSYDKTGLTSAKIIQYDNCSHDSDNPQPCEPTVRMEWSA